MKIVSVNVNGIRAAGRKGFYQWMAKEQPDIVCMQELKAQPDQITDALYHPQGYHSYFHSAEKKGYSGVGIYSRIEPDNVQVGLGWEEFDSEGRYLQVDYPGLSVVSLYMPSGSSKEERQDFKYMAMGRFEPLLKKMQKQDREWLICGDWNIAHKKIDIKNWRGNQKNSGFLPEERAWMDWLFGDAGFIDAFREVDEREEQYTWWSNRGQAWDNNTGWRIDYHVVTPGLGKKVTRAEIYKDERFSDHAPLTLEYDF
ncbi:MAG: exodeoxyribonuclease III [Proteobacteria bacterium]|jgi:exodeoxyribonuclease III|nr:exodeoxyribonuclease III [Pseudomonadota bacterium]